MSTTPKQGLTELQNNAGQYLVVNLDLATIDQLLAPAIVDKDLTAAPGSPADGAMYIMASAWTGITLTPGSPSAAAGYLVFWRASANAWTVMKPIVGQPVRVLDEVDANSVPKLYVCKTTGATATWSVPEGALTNPMTTAGDLIVGGASGSPSRLAGGTNGKVLQMVAGAPAWADAGVQSIIIACSDETTGLTTGVGKVTFRMPYAFTLTGVRASLTTAQATNGSGGIFTVDINEGGSTILSTKLTIDNTEKTSTTAATAAVISDTSLADDAEITIDIDQVGDGTAKGLKVMLIGVKS